MRYIYPLTTDINNYDLALLAQEIKNAGLPIQAIHSGNSALVFEFINNLNDTEKTVLQGLVSTHIPIWFEWTENGQSKKAKVKCAEDVDMLTAQRIRSAAGGNDPVQEQLKKLTRMLEDVLTAIKNAASLVDIKTAVINILTQHSAFLDARKDIIQQGKDFKTLKGW